MDLRPIRAAMVEQAWEKGSAACKLAQAETDCDGVRKYLRDYPNGSHAEQAKAMVNADDVRLAHVRSARDASLAVSKKLDDAAAAAIKKLEDATGLKITKMRAVVRDSSLQTGKVVEIKYDLTIVKKQIKGTTLKLRAACQVDDKRMVDNVTGTIEAPSMNVGDTVEDDVTSFIGAPLTKAPSMCELLVLKGSILGTAGDSVHTYCLVPGKGVRDGSCMWPAP